MQDVAKGLKDLLEYDENVEEDFGLTFEVIINNKLRENTEVFVVVVLAMISSKVTINNK